MALWQFDYTIVPSNTNNKEVHLISWKDIELNDEDIKKIEKILPATQSWSKDIKQFGKEDSTCIEILYDNKKIDEITGRLDIRILTRKNLGDILSYINYLNGDIMYNNTIYKAKINVILNLIKQSDAFKFCENPENYLEKLRLENSSE